MAQDLSDYVYLEAKEKAFEIEIEARKTFEKRKQDVVNKELTKLEAEFEKKLGDKETKYKM